MHRAIDLFEIVTKRMFPIKNKCTGLLTKTPHVDHSLGWVLGAKNIDMEGYKVICNYSLICYTTQFLCVRVCTYSFRLYIAFIYFEFIQRLLKFQID